MFSDTTVYIVHMYAVQSGLPFHTVYIKGKVKLPEPAEQLSVHARIIPRQFWRFIKTPRCMKPPPSVFLLTTVTTKVGFITLRRAWRGNCRDRAGGRAASINTSLWPSLHLCAHICIYVWASAGTEGEPGDKSCSPLPLFLLKLSGSHLVCPSWACG